MTNAVTVAQGGSNNVTMRNRFINGQMQIAQRGTSFTASGYSLDRWYLVVLGSSTITQSSNAPAGFTNSLLWTTNSASTPANVAYYNGFSQMVEGYNVSDLGFGASGAKSVTFSFWVKANNAGTYPLAFNNATSSGSMNSAGRSYVTTYTVSSANTWEQKTITIAGDTSGTWNTTTSAGFTVWFDVGSGSNYTTSTLNAWQSGAYFYTSGVVNVQNTNSATLQITGVQLEAGTTASPFEYRQYGTELALCQRYYEKSFAQGTAPAEGVDNNFQTTGAGYATNGLYIPNVGFKVTKRTTATVTVFRPNVTATNGNFAVYSSALGGWNTSTTTVNSANDTTFSINLTSNINVDKGYAILGAWTASAEL